MKTITTLFALVVLGIGVWMFIGSHTAEAPVDTLPAVVDFETCVVAGNAIMESYPRQCRSESGELFVENIGNELEKSDLIHIQSPRPNEVITTPVTITGEARGYWFFEASFPIMVTDWDGLIIGEGYATANGEWMTEEFVPFTATVVFTVPTDTPYKRGTLILKKDNPSGLPEHDDALEIPVRFLQ